MSFEILISHRDRDRISGLRTGILSTINVKSGFNGAILEMEDLNFHHDSAVMLPDYKKENAPDPGTSEQDRITGIKVLATCFCWASQNKNQKLLVAGHTDTTGSKDYNLNLSQLRADNVLYALLGNKNKWVAICEGKNKVEDYQQILKWIAERYGWDCDPGKIDNQSGSKTKAAVIKFKETYNIEYNQSIIENDIVDTETWGAFFDVYMHDLEILLGVDSAGLSSLRNDLQFIDTNKKSVGCGENFPIEAQRKDNYRSKTNRRVELLFFEPGDEPLLNCHPSPGICSHQKCEIYNSKIYKFQHIPWKVHLPKPVEVSVEITEIAGLYKPGYNDPTDIANNTTKSSGYKPGYKSDDNKGRIFINNIPRINASTDWDSIWKKDTQYIELTAEVKPSSASLPTSAVIVWEWTDPDDPFNQDSSVRDDAGEILDPNDYNQGLSTAKGDDNFGVRDFPAVNTGVGADYEEISPHTLKKIPATTTCETLISNNASKVRFHCTNVAGDNFKIKASIKPHPLIKPQKNDETGIMTMWKRIDVEYRKMPDAYDLPVSKIPDSFEKAYVQLNITDPQNTPKIEFLAQSERDFDRKSSAYVKTPPKGVFAHENKPGWFLLVAALQAKKDVGTASSVQLYKGTADIDEITYSGGDKGEVVIVPSRVQTKVSHIIFLEGSNHLLMTVWRSDVDTPVHGKTTLHIRPLDYQSEFKPGTGLLGNPGDGGAYDRTDNYYPLHKLELPANNWVKGGLGFSNPVNVVVFSPGNYATGGVSPENIFRGKGYFAGRTIIFTKHPGYTKFAASDVKIGGVWKAAETLTVNIDGTDVNYTVVSGDNTDKIAEAFVKSINNNQKVKTKVVAFKDSSTIKLNAVQRGTPGNGITVTVKNSSAAGTIVTAGALSGGGPDVQKLLSTAVHELGHAFGFPHKCGYYTFENPPEKSCAMNYSNTWLYKLRTKDVQRFFTGKDGINMCALHLDGIRKVHLEDNPAMWIWK